MLFKLHLIFILICVNKSFEIQDTETHQPNDCSVHLQTDQGIKTCQRQQCMNIKDPWRVIGSYLNGQTCYVQSLQLFFTNYDQFLVFVELQYASHTFVESIFPQNSAAKNVLEIHIGKIYPLSDPYFLTEDTLKKLSGPQGLIRLLEIQIYKWYKSPRAKPQTIENGLVDRQSFEQIAIYYPCNSQLSIERVILAKYLAYQERSTCLSQIRVINGEEYRAPRAAFVPRRHLYNSDFIDVAPDEGGEFPGDSPVGGENRLFESGFTGRLRFDSDDPDQPARMNIAQSSPVERNQRLSNQQRDRILMSHFDDEKSSDSAQHVLITNPDHPANGGGSGLYNSAFNGGHRFTSINPSQAISEQSNLSNSVFIREENDPSPPAKVSEDERYYSINN